MSEPCPYQSPAGANYRCGVGGKHAGLTVSPGTCRACLGIMPPLSEQAANLAGAAARAAGQLIRGGPVLVSAEEAERRIAVCRACNLFNAEQERCRRCGCYVNIKDRLFSERCPEGKW